MSNDFDSSGMSEEEYNAALQEFLEEQQEEMREELKRTYGDEAVIEDKDKGVEPTLGFTVTFEFEARIMEESDVEAWAELVLKTLPDNTKVTIAAATTFVNVEDLTDKHVGNRVKVVIGAHTVEGVLDGVFSAGEGSGHARVLVINGTAWRTTFGVVEVNPTK